VLCDGQTLTLNRFTVDVVINLFVVGRSIRHGSGHTANTLTSQALLQNEEHDRGHAPPGIIMHAAPKKNLSQGLVQISLVMSTQFWSPL